MLCVTVSKKNSLGRYGRCWKVRATMVRLRDFWRDSHGDDEARLQNKIPIRIGGEGGELTTDRPRTAQVFLYDNYIVYYTSTVNALLFPIRPKQSSRLFTIVTSRIETFTITQSARTSPFSTVDGRFWMVIQRLHGNGYILILSNRIAFTDKEICANLFHTSCSHALEASLVRLMNLWNLEVILLKLLHKLGGIQLAVASSSLDDLGLLLQCEVLPGKIRSDVFLEQTEHLVVGDGAWVGKVVDASVSVRGHQDGGGEEIVEDGVGVGNVHHTLVLSDLSNKVTAVQIITDWHSKSEDESIGVVLHDLLTS